MGRTGRRGKSRASSWKPSASCGKTWVAKLPAKVLSAGLRQPTKIFLVCPAIYRADEHGIQGFLRQARRVADGQGRYIVKGSLKEWQDFLDEDQIAWSVLYPTAGLTFGLIRDKDWACVIAKGYNNYLYETFTKPEERLKGMALIPLQSIPEAIEELRRAVKELGFVGAVLTAVGLRQPFGDPKYFPVYEAAQELDALLAVHAAPTQGIGVDGFDKLIEVRTLSHGFGQMIQMTSMIYGGVFDRFPKLKIAYAEAGCGWVPYLMERMDMEYEHRSA